MRFGISATSGILPKNLRTRLRPLKVWVWAIVAPCLPLACQYEPSFRTRSERRPIQTDENPFPESRLSGLQEKGFRVFGAASVRGHVPADRRLKLLQLNLGAGSLELRLDLLGFVLRYAFLHRLGRGLDQILGLLQAQARDGAHFLDHVDLLGAGIGQDDVELGLLLSRRSRSRSTAGYRRNRHRSSRRDAPLLFKHLRKLCRLK